MVTTSGCWTPRRQFKLLIAGVHQSWADALSFSIMGLSVGVVWLHRIWGMATAPLVFAGLWAFCPILLAHAATVGPDVGAASMGVLAGFLYWRYLLSPSKASAAWAGIGGGLAILSKLTWITGLVSLPLVALMFVSWHRDGRWGQIRRTSWHLAIAGFVSLVVVNAGYGSEGTGTPLSDFDFCSRRLGDDNANVQQLGNRFREFPVLSQLPVPIPRNFLLGIDYLQMEVEQQAWSFLVGQWKEGSWPYYYLLTIAWKTPDIIMAAWVVATAYLTYRGLRGKIPDTEVAFYLQLVRRICG